MILFFETLLTLIGVTYLLGVFFILGYIVVDSYTRYIERASEDDVKPVVVPVVEQPEQLNPSLWC
jgi:Tfp pilus assembly protein PilE